VAFFNCYPQKTKLATRANAFCALHVQIQKACSKEMLIGRKFANAFCAWLPFICVFFVMHN
jgi:hypothetical protein